MKCPLKFRLQDITSEKDRIYTGDCLKEKCAWWDKTGERCQVQSIEAQLDGIRTALFDLVAEIAKGGKP